MSGPLLKDRVLETTTTTGTGTLTLAGAAPGRLLDDAAGAADSRREGNMPLTGWAY